MKKVTTATGKNVFVNLNGLRTANAFQAKNQNQDFWIALNYGAKTDKGQTENELVGPFQTMEAAETIIETLM